MLKKILLISFLTVLLSVALYGVAFAYINFNINGPDFWFNPGYMWSVQSDAGFGNAVCLQWSIDDSLALWDRNECIWVGPGDDQWQCSIPTNLPDERVHYQFYKDIDADDCVVNGNEWEWTSQFYFDTGASAISLDSLKAASPHPGWGWAGVLVIGLLVAGLAWSRRR